MLAISSIECLSSLRNFTNSFLTSKDVKAFLGVKTVRKFGYKVSNLPQTYLQHIKKILKLYEFLRRSDLFDRRFY